MRKVFLLAYLVCALPLLAQAQFNSGSTGADGALDLSTCPTSLCEVQLPDSGILNYTTVNVPSNKTLGFKKNSRNTPIIMLAQGNVIIAGAIQISANNSFNVTREPGPGGFFGGASQQNGFGPGGGRYDPTGSDTNKGRWVGSFSLIPIIGGSGGAGISGAGGGGGGAIVIASSTTITLSGSISANGGGSSAKCGSGGAIRLVGNTINVSGNISAICSVASDTLTNGVIRFEAPPGQLFFTGSSFPIPVISQINPVIIPTVVPTLRIASIGGFAVPSYSAGQLNTADLILPVQLPDPISLVIQAGNVPVGTEITFQISGPSGTATNCTLAGTLSSSSCTSNLTGFSRSTGVVTSILAVAIFSPPPLAKGVNPTGPNQVAQIRLEVPLGKQPKFVFLTKDNRPIEPKQLNPKFLQYFGM